METCWFFCVCFELSQYVLINLCICVAGVFWRELGLGPRDGGGSVAQGGRQEVVEETLLPATSFWNLLCP